MMKKKQPQEVESDVAEEDMKNTEEAESPDNSSDDILNANDTDFESQEDKKESPHASGLGTWVPIAILALLILSLLFLFFVAFSASLIKPVYLFSLDVSVDAKVDKVSGSVQFGVWGYCSSATTNTVGIGPFKHTSSSGGGCSPAHIGWNFDGIPGPFSTVTKATSRFASGLFVFHLLAWLLLIPVIGVCALALFKPDIFNRSSSNPSKKSADSDEAEGFQDYDDGDGNIQNSATSRKHKSIPGFVVFICALLLSFILLIDLIVLGTTGHNVAKLSKGAATLKFGNAFFLVMAAMIILWLAFVLAVLDLTYRIGKDAEKDTDKDETNDDDDDIEITDKTKDKDERSEAGNERLEERASSGSDYGDDMHEVDLTDRA